MKTELTTEQSHHLIELGVPKEKASEVENGGAGNEVDKYIYTFTLTDLLVILPKEIVVTILNKYQEEIKAKHRFTFEWLGYGYLVGYKEFAINPNLITKFMADELIDALYELTVWCIENGHLKFE